MPCSVSLISHTTDPVLTVAAAAKLCYSACSALEIQEKQDLLKAKEFISFLHASGHLSPLEHASFSFAVDGLSRVASHQLVRHRIASFSQQSQRYVVMENPLCVLPTSVSKNEEAQALYMQQVKSAHDVYEKLVSLGVPKEDARFILPHGWETRLVVTMNARELHHFFALRLCRRAQWEIQALARKMLKLVLTAAPELFATAGPACLSQTGCNEKKPCGQPYENREALLLE